MDYEVDGSWVVGVGERGEVGGEEFGYFEGGIDGEAVLEGLFGGGFVVSERLWLLKVW